MSGKPDKYELATAVNQVFESFRQLDADIPSDDLAAARQRNHGLGIHPDSIVSQWNILRHTLQAELADRTLNSKSPTIDDNSLTIRRHDVRYHHGSAGGVGVLTLRGNTGEGKIVTADRLFASLDPAKPDQVTHGFTRVSADQYAGVYKLSTLYVPRLKSVEAVQDTITALATDNWTNIATTLSRRLFAPQPNGANLRLTASAPELTDQSPPLAANPQPPLG